MSAPELSAEERATVDRFEAAPAAEESLRERVAVAIAQSGYESVIDDDAWQVMFREDEREDFRDYADAAIAVLRGPSGDAERAVERVVALADFHAECCEYVKVRDLRNAVAGQ